MKVSHGNITLNTLYESPTGCLNQSIVELSGKYKVIVSKRSNNYALYLGDYTGFRAPLDMTKSFMSQVSDFLKTVPSYDISKTLYAGYSSKDHYSYHIPFYISRENTQFPSHAVIMQVPNKEFDVDTISDFYRSSSTLDVINLTAVNITSIFKEIIDLDLKAPVRLNWRGDNSTHTVILRGFDYVQNTITEVPINIREYVLNNNNTNDDITFLNDLILRKFEENHLIYPSFINLEFEFDFNKEDELTGVDFQNFYAFLSTSNAIDVVPQELPESSKIIKTYFFSGKKTDFTDINLNDETTTILESRDEVVDSVVVSDINEQDFLYRVSPIKFTVNDVITITSENRSILEYRIQDSDIRDTLYSTMIHVGKRIEFLTNGFIQVSTTSDKIWYLYSSVETTYKFKTGNRISTNYKILDRSVNDTDYFNALSITLNDVMTRFDIDVPKLRINNRTYNILKEFTYNRKHIIRLDRNPKIKVNTNAEMVEVVWERFEEFIPFPILNTYNTLRTLPLYDFDEYASEIAGVHPTYYKIYQSPKRGDIDLPNESRTHFVSGSNKYASINSMEYDERAGYDVSPLDYGYFCIKGVCPEYLQSDYRKLRYFTNKPILRSVFRPINRRTVECCYLGVKYSTDIKYDGYKLAVYIDCDRSNYDTTDPYYVDIDDEHMTIDVVINKSLLLKQVNEFGIDLSLFTNINNTFELSDRDTSAFNPIGFRFGHKIKQSDFAKTPYTDLVTPDGKFLVVRDPHTRDYFSDLYHEGETFTTNFYASVWIEEREETVQFVPFRITFTDISEIRRDYFLVSDIIIESIMGEVNELTSIPESLFAQIDGTGKYHDISNYHISLISPNQADILGTYYQKVTSVRNEIRSLSIWEEMYLPNYINPNTVEEQANSISIPSRGIIAVPIVAPEPEPEPVPEPENPNEPNFRDIIGRVSLRSQYFAIRYKDGARAGVEFVDKHAFQREFGSLSETQLEARVNDRLQDPAFRAELLNEQNFRIDLFDINKFWDLVSTACTDMITGRMTEDSIRDYMSQFRYQLYYSYLTNNLLSIKDSDRKIKLDIILPDKNKSGMGDMTRYSLDYNPYYTKFSSIIESQKLNESMDDIRIIHTLFDNNFGLTQSETKDLAIYNDVTATGLWQEIHSIVSSLFVAQDIELKCSPRLDRVQIDKVLYDELFIERMIINNTNDTYILTKSGDIFDYIRSTYIKYILEKFYTVDSVLIDDNRIEFSYDKSTSEIIFNDVVEECKIILKRI